MRHIPFAFMSEQAVGPSYLLDTYTGSTMAYSTRQLSSTATNCIQAWRQSDSATQDIGFSGGFIDTAALLSFAAGGTVAVKIWYDQSGNGNDLLGSGVTTSPVVVIGGTLQTSNSLATVFFQNGSGTSTVLNTASPITSTDVFSIYYAGTRALTTSKYLFGGTAAASAPAIITRYSGLDFEWYAAGSERYTLSSSGGSNTNLSSLAVTRSTGTNNLKGYFGGSNVFTQTATQNLSSSDFQTLGGSSPIPQDPFGGRISEWIVWIGTNNDSDTTAITADQISYFSI